MSGLAESGRVDFQARSMLFVPADAGRFLAKAANRGADLIVLDLEDGVAPSAKERARASLHASVPQLRQAGAVVYVRVNHDPGLLGPDLDATVASGADGVVLPKIETPEQLARIDAALSEQERTAGRDACSLRSIALIETPMGVCAAPAIAKSSRRLVAMCFGAEDFSTAMGIEPSVEAMTWPAQAVAIAAAAAGLEPLGMPASVGDFSDLSAYREVALHARRIGIRGGVCIHPAQVDALNQAFAATAAEIAAAERLVAAFDRALAQGKGSIALDGRMIDEPIAVRARKFLQRQRRSQASDTRPQQPI